MAFKFVVVLALVTVASAGYIPQAPQEQQYYHQAPAPVEHTVSLAPSAPGQHQLVAKKVEEYDPHPQYKFAYDVQDSLTGDSKSHSETRDGDNVEGEYSLIDADGFKRIVHYTADAEHGFNAVVSRVPLHEAHHDDGPHHQVKAAPAVYAAAPAVVKTVQPVQYAAPVNNHAHAPAVYTAPASSLSYKSAAPVALVKNIAPSSYAAPAINYYKSDDASYSAPSTYYKSVPVSNVHGQESYSSLLSSGYHH